MRTALALPAVAALTLTLGLHQPPAPTPPPPPAELATPADLITTQRGTIPVIISAPHGGTIRVPGSTDRTGKGAVTVRDVNTADMALLVAQRLTDRLGAKPYFVIAQFSRKDADANRAEEGGEAVENDAARAQYRAYHKALAAAVKECRDKYGDALLIDLHGQVKRPDALVRGTRNGKTVSALTKRAGAEALTGPDSVFGQLKAAGYPIIPDAEGPEENAGKETFFDGGYIVAHYGADQPDGIDAIQIEVGSQRSNNLLKVSRDIADAIAHFATKHYMSKSPP